MPRRSPRAPMLTPFNMTPMRGSLMSTTGVSPYGCEPQSIHLIVVSPVNNTRKSTNTRSANKKRSSKPVRRSSPRRSTQRRNSPRRSPPRRTTQRRNNQRRNNQRRRIIVYKNC